MIVLDRDEAADFTSKKGTKYHLENWGGQLICCKKIQSHMQPKSTGGYRYIPSKWIKVQPTQEILKQLILF